MNYLLVMVALIGVASAIYEPVANRNWTYYPLDSSQARPTTTLLPFTSTPATGGGSDPSCYYYCRLTGQDASECEYLCKWQECVIDCEKVVEPQLVKHCGDLCHDIIPGGIGLPPKN